MCEKEREGRIASERPGSTRTLLAREQTPTVNISSFTLGDIYMHSYIYIMYNVQEILSIIHNRK